MRLPFTLRRAIRSLLQYPGLTIMAVLALAFGIGLPTATFSMVDASVMRGLPVNNADRLMHLERRKMGTRGEGFGVAARDYVTWRAQQKSFETMGAYRTGTVTLRAGEAVDRWEAGYLTPDVLAMLGTKASLGRVFNADDARADIQPPVLLADHVWRDRFNRDASLAGRTVSVDGVSYTVLGIMPANFRFPTEADLWIPFSVPASAASDANFPQFEAIGTLRAGTSRETARAEFSVIAERVASAYPATNRHIEVTVKPFTERYVGEVATATMYVMLAAVLLVLIIACANVANLLLVRAVHRSRDVAIAMAIGATRRRIVQQVLVESGLIALIGGLLGLVVARVGILLLGQLFAGRMPYWAEPRLDTTVVLFATVLVGAAALLAGVIPAFKTTQADLSKTLRDDSRGATGVRANRLMQSLVVVELALSMSLLVVTGLLTMSTRKASNVNLGFPTAALFTARISLPARYTIADRSKFYDELERRVANEASVSAIGLISSLPGTHAPFVRTPLEGTVYRDIDDMPTARYAAASAQFFQTLKIPAERGRLFNAQDVANSEPVAIVNARFVQRFISDGNALGKRIRVGTAAEASWRTVVGVVPNLWMGAFDSSPERNPSGVYIPLAQSAATSVSLAVQAKSNAPLSIADAVRAAAFSIDRDVPIYDVHDIPQLVEAGTWFYGLGAGILGACGAAALLLASVGVYGVIAFSVGRRRREFGVRMALGADARAIIRLVVGQGLLQVVFGLSLGLMLAIVLAQGAASLLFEVSPASPIVFGGVALALGTVAALAMLIPAISASRTQPLEALRSE